MVPAVRPLGSLSMARGCARIDSRPDTAKIGSADRVEVHHARLLAVIGVRKTFPHGLDPKRTLKCLTVRISFEINRSIWRFVQMTPPISTRQRAPLASTRNEGEIAMKSNYKFAAAIAACRSCGSRRFLLIGVVT